MRGAFDIFLAVSLIVIFLVAPARGDDGYRRRLVELENRFADRYVGIAKKAKQRRLAELTREAFNRAERLDPGNDVVIEFDSGIKRPVPEERVRAAAKLRAEYTKIIAGEARARRDLALWCDEEVLLEEAVEQAAAAFALVPGGVTFDANGVLSSKTVGTLTGSLSLSVLEEFEVFRGSLVRLDKLPSTVAWKDAWKLRTEHFEIVTTVSGDVCRTLGRALEAAREIYREETGYEVESRIVVHVPATRQKYIDIWLGRNRPRPEPTNLGRCYRDFCAVDGSKPKRGVVSVAIHEVAHGYLNLGLEAATGMRGATMPCWFHEGLATYCAGYGKDSLSFERGVVLPEIARQAPLRRFRELIEAGGAMELDEFLGAETGDTDYYLHAYAFFWFLHDSDDERVRKGFAAATSALKRAKLSTEDRMTRGKKIFVAKIGVPIADLETLFIEWVKSTGRAEPLTQRGV